MIYINIKKISISFLFIFLLFFVQCQQIEAAPKTFNDNFNSEVEGNFPSKWILANDPDATVCPGNWKIKDGMVGFLVSPGVSCATNIIPKDSEWNNLGSNYIFELDIKFVNGTDHNIAFRFKQNTTGFNDWYELHFQSPGDFNLSRPIGTYITKVPGNYPNGSTYHLKIIVNGNSIKVYIDNVLVRDFVSNPDIFPSGRIALRAGTGSGISETYFDNIVVTSLEADELNLPVPLLKQTDSKWANDLYDSADKWESAGKRFIKDKGCAITSAAMVFNYHKITKMPDGSALTPKSLNTWLKSQSDGYIPNGNTNWWALARLSRLAKVMNPQFSFNVLQFSWGNDEDHDFVEDELRNDRPVILEVPGHFIVAKGRANDSFIINDPGYNRTSLSSYDNSFISTRNYVPHNSDLSYIVVAANENVDLVLLDEFGNEVGKSTIQQPMNNASDGSVSNSPALKIFDYAQAPSGTYTLRVLSNSTVTNNMTIYVYDIQGDVKMFKVNHIASSEETAEFTIQFDKDNAKNSFMPGQTTTFESIRDEIRSLEQQGKFYDNNMEEKLLRTIDQAESAYKSNNKNNISLAMNFLRHFQQILEQQKNKKIDIDAYLILKEKSDSLINSVITSSL